MGDLENVLGPFGDTFDPEACQRNFDQLDTTSLDTGGKQLGIRFGTGTVHFTAGIQSSAVATIAHGFGHTPAAITVTGLVSLAPAAWTFHTQAWTATSFGVWARQDSAPGTGDVSFSWIAIG